MFSSRKGIPTTVHPCCPFFRTDAVHCLFRHFRDGKNSTGYKRAAPIVIIPLSVSVSELSLASPLRTLRFEIEVNVIDRKATVINFGVSRKGIHKDNENQVLSFLNECKQAELADILHALIPARREEVSCFLEQCDAGRDVLSVLIHQLCTGLAVVRLGSQPREAPSRHVRTSTPRQSTHFQQDSPLPAAGILV